jgi:hypothetical protein
VTGQFSGIADRECIINLGICSAAVHESVRPFETAGERHGQQATLSFADNGDRLQDRQPNLLRFLERRTWVGRDER